jgi:hypothetical protein
VRVLLEGPGRTPVPALQLLQAKDDCGFSPLHWACQEGHEATVRAVLAALPVARNGSSAARQTRVLEARTDVKDTPAMLAAYNGHAGCLRLLRAAGGDLTLRGQVRGCRRSGARVGRGRCGPGWAALRQSGPAEATRAHAAACVRGGSSSSQRGTVQWEAWHELTRAYRSDTGDV